MPQRNSRHGAFIEQIVAAINNGAKAEELFRSSAYRNSEIPRRRHTEMLITSWKKNQKEGRRMNISQTSPSSDDQIGSEISSTMTTESIKDAKAGKENKQEDIEGENDLKGTVKDRGEAVDELTTPALNVSSTTPKPQKHIRPCKCDLTPEQLRRIQEMEEARRQSKEQLQRRIKVLKEYFNSKRITPRPTLRTTLRTPGKTPEEEEEDENDDKYLREHIERVKIVKKKSKRKPRDKRKPVTTKKIRRKKYRKPFKVKVGIMLKINYRKPPLIPVKPTRTSVLRTTEHAYCPNKCYVPPMQSPPAGDGKFEVHFKASSEVTIKRNRTWELRLKKAKNWKPPSPEVYKYDRPPFEANTRIYKLLKPVKANIAA